MGRIAATFAAVGLALVGSGPAAAANFGFVRWPDYLDMYILIAAIASGVGIVWVKVVIPGGRGLFEVPKADRTFGMKLAGYFALIAFVALMGMVFVGMGLQRAVE
jgi:hypothetical protein